MDFQTDNVVPQQVKTSETKPEDLNSILEFVKRQERTDSTKLSNLHT